MKVINLIAGAAAALALAATFAPTGAVAGTTIIGGPGDTGTGNCFPFGCTTFAPSYQQVYASSDFSGPITIKDLVFYNNNFSGGAALTGTYTIDLSVTSAAVNGLDLNTLSNNIGTNDVTVFNGALPSISGGELIIPLATPYTYDPTGGNLLLNLSASGLSGGGVYLDVRYGTAGGLFSRAMTPGCCTMTDDTGLVTGFSTGVPEPATWAMMLFGMLGLGAVLRAHRRADRDLATLTV